MHLVCMFMSGVARTKSSRAQLKDGRTTARPDVKQWTHMRYVRLPFEKPAQLDYVLSIELNSFLVTHFIDC